MRRGFTLVEVLVVMGIVVLLFAGGYLVTVDTYGKNLLGSEEEKLVSILSKARSRAMNNIDATDHQVEILLDKYVLDSDEEIERNEKIEISGITEITFEQLSGRPDEVGDIVLNDGTRTETITINQEGMINW
ncbi:MAG: prepilin-type N-terminal cleavage/methylation domain-containing protein [Patescibacteria group bacterium]